MGKKENAVEQPVCDYAESLGFEVRKIQYVAHYGAPDRMFYGYGQLFFIEFKSPEGVLSSSQKREIKKMHDADIKAFVVDDVEQGKLIIDDAIILGLDYE